jgi:hypothetical protein
VSRYSFFLASPEYLETSGLFKFTGTTEQMGAGDAIWFPLETQFATEVPQASSSSNRMLHPVAAAAANLVAAAGTDKREDFSFGFLGTPQSFQQS